MIRVKSFRQRAGLDATRNLTGTQNGKGQPKCIPYAVILRVLLPLAVFYKVHPAKTQVGTG